MAACRQLSQQGIAATERGDLVEGERLLARAVDACPAEPDARRQYAEVLWQRGERNKALTQMEQARKAASNDVAITVRTGELYLAAGNTSQAERLANAAIDADPRNSSAWKLRGKTRQAEKSLRAALSDFQRALSYNPQDPEVLYQISECYRGLQQPDRALSTLQSLLETYPPGEEPSNALYLQGLAQMALGRHVDAAASFTLCNQRSAPSPETLCRLAEAEIASGRPDHAKAAVEYALSLDPNHATSRQLLSQTAGEPRIASAPQIGRR